MSLLVGYDSHPASRSAMLFAHDLAETLHENLYVVHVVDINDTPINPDRIDWEVSTEQHLEVVREQVTALLGDSADDWTYRSERGDAVNTLIELAIECRASMIVVGRPQHGVGAAIDHLVTGAVARTLVRRSSLPVVIVPDSWRSLR